jgi:hypothetical protein
MFSEIDNFLKKLSISLIFPKSSAPFTVVPLYRGFKKQLDHYILVKTFEDSLH